jgi:hypothetical protein
MMSAATARSLSASRRVRRRRPKIPRKQTVPYVASAARRNMFMAASSPYVERST